MSTIFSPNVNFVFYRVLSQVLVQYKS